jgi:hypothetical protein
MNAAATRFHQIWYKSKSKSVQNIYALAPAHFPVSIDSNGLKRSDK